MKRAVGISFVTIGVIIFLFFKDYSGSVIPYPTLWLLLGIAILIIGVRFFIPADLRFKKQKDESVYSEIERLKRSNERIEVNFDECEIVSNQYFDEVPRSSNSRVQAYDSFYDNSRTVKLIEQNQSRIIYKDKRAGDERIYISPLITKDRITLSFMLDKQGGTTIYLDQSDNTRYFFDLDFLDG